MQIVDGIETGKKYYWKRSKGWDWFGTTRWWEYFVEFAGFNGSGGLWLVETSSWNGSDQEMFRQPRSLSREDSAKVVEQVKANLSQKDSR
jgi:hypothetical protein